METPRTRLARIVGVVLGLALVALVIVRWRAPGPEKAAGAASGSASGRAATRPPKVAGANGGGPSLPAMEPPAPSFAPGVSRKERAKFTLASYLDWARYPPTSRPARERPDRQKPHSVSPRSLPLAKADKSASKVSLVLSQTHYYLSGDEVCALTVSCRNGDEPAPCSVTSARVDPSPDAAGQLPAGAIVTFADDGKGADKAAGDGAWTATLAPAQLGFSGSNGPLLVTVSVDAGGEQGTGNFQVSYTGSAPALFTGAVRETLEHGSLSLCVEMQVVEAGRYVLDARADDAAGETFAFLSFNDTLPAGKTEACFTLFGKLVIDEGAKAPFKLRDVEGFLLLEDAFPDRKTVPTLEGAAHTTKAYSASDFSSEEWQSPVKDRYVGQLKKDADETE